LKIAVIGAGISGLSAAQLLNATADVVLFERESRAGGLIKCDRVNDCLFHKVGGHVFNSRNQQVLDWFWSFFNKEQEFLQARRKAKIFFNGKLIGYPIENYLYELDAETVRHIIAELLALQKQPRLAPLAYPDFETFLKQNFGNTLYEQYFRPYNYKIWRTDLATVSMEWLEGKLPMPDLAEILQSNIVRTEEASMVHATFYYPKEGGSQFIADRLREGLTIRHSADIQDVLLTENGKMTIGDEVFDKVIYSGDIRKIFPAAKEIFRKHGIDVAYVEALRSNGTSNLFCETDANDLSWLYIPQDFTRAHRIIYTGNFSDTNNRGSLRKTCVVEFSGEVPFDVMAEEIKKLPGNLEPLGYNYEPDSYVIQDHQTRQVMARVKEALASENIYLLGRFAEWEYYNMDKAVEAAMALVQKLKTDQS
jgi:protoporphyrinogen oxidase